jgi:hypothetical protein
MKRKGVLAGVATPKIDIQSFHWSIPADPKLGCAFKQNMKRHKKGRTANTYIHIHRQLELDQVHLFRKIYKGREIHTHPADLILL